MISILLPTYNRSKKLRRVLDFYAGYESTIRIVVLDGSDDQTHQALNQEAADFYAHIVRRIAAPTERNVLHRLLNFLDHDQEDVFAIGNDEDAFFPDFLEMAVAHLRSHEDYVAVTGRYITSARPLVGLRRISFWTDSFVGFDVDYEDPALRVINFQRFIAAGVPPLFWSIRRKGAFVRSMELGTRLAHGSSQELLDQVNTCVMGKIMISDMPMLLRDESRHQYRPEKTRDAGKYYIGEKDLAEIVKISQESWGPEITVAVKAVASWFVPNKDGESGETRLNSRVYCRFSPTEEARSKRTLRWLQVAIKWSCIGGNILAQFFAYMYFVKYMRLKGKGRSFIKMSKVIPVHE
jgi:glycosyltransferase domain-containing protein